jgi:dTMP kinase
MPLEQGLFITFEGGDGSGKTTLLHRIDDTLRQQGRIVVKTREPGGSSLGEQVREWLLHKHHPICLQAELMLFLAGRAQHVDELIKPAIQSGKIVLCDRFNDSTVAYQAYARELDKDLVQNLCDFACNGTLPDITFFLDLDPIEGLKRTQKRGNVADRFEQQKIEFHQKVRFGMQQLAKKFPERICVLDASQSQDEVFNNAWRHLSKTII